MFLRSFSRLRGILGSAMQLGEYSGSDEAAPDGQASTMFPRFARLSSNERTTLRIPGLGSARLISIAPSTAESLNHANAADKFSVIGTLRTWPDVGQESVMRIWKETAPQVGTI